MGGALKHTVVVTTCLITVQRRGDRLRGDNRAVIGVADTGPISKIIPLTGSELMDRVTITEVITKSRNGRGNVRRCTALRWRTGG